jgi:AcrR family transcriptional regulator
MSTSIPEVVRERSSERSSGQAAHSPERLSARDRLLEAADELFYEQGVHTVGIDRVIERAGVAKATLYSTFGSKEGLVRAYLERRHQSRKQRITRGLARYDNPRDKLLGVFDILGDLFAEPGYRGCAFVNASAESPAGSSVEQVSDEYRGWVRSVFVELASEAGAANPAGLARQLYLLYDGATTSARMDHDPGAAAAAKATAALLVDAAVT